MKTSRFRFPLPKRGEPGYEPYLHCSTTVGDPRIGAKCHNPVVFRIARTPDAKTGVRYACQECAAPYPDPSQVIDLMAALKESLRETAAKEPG